MGIKKEIWILAGIATLFIPFVVKQVSNLAKKKYLRDGVSKCKLVETPMQEKVIFERTVPTQDDLEFTNGAKLREQLGANNEQIRELHQFFQGMADATRIERVVSTRKSVGEATAETEGQVSAKTGRICRM